MSQQGLVTAVFGRQYLVQIASVEVNLSALGRKSDFAVGDQVKVRDAGTNQAVIEAVLPRRNVYFRSDAFKAKQLAANIDQVLCVIAGDPLFNEEHLFRASIAAAVAEVEFVVVHNKADLSMNAELMAERMAVWKALGYQVLDVSAKHNAIEAQALLGPLLQSKTSLLIGQSGMGKSTLLNLLVPGAQQRTQEISRALNSGKQTTTFTQAFRLSDAANELLIDSPGFSEFGLAHLSESQIQHAIPELKKRLGLCRFNNCKHSAEPDCAVRLALANGEVDEVRYGLIGKVL